ncbi:MAG: hypothetical protein KF845_13830 [Cyclobacteriaceae bacterium]|nr:hypothetical protein [Cyclobacteriaceae bacterium]
MNKKECPSCAMEIDVNSKVCPVCSYEFPKSNTAARWIVLLLVLLFVVYMLMGIF